MKQIFYLVVCALMIFVASGAVPPGLTSTPGDDSAQLIAAERAGAKAFVDRDVETLDKLISSDYVEIVLKPAATTTKADWEVTGKAAWLGVLRSGREKYESVDLRNLKVYLHGDVATVAGEYSQTGTKDGKDISATGLYVDTWVKRNGRWQWVSGVFP